MSNYRCREHLDQGVNWRGAGCPQCDKARRQRRRKPHTTDREDNPS